MPCRFGRSVSFGRPTLVAAEQRSGGRLLCVRSFLVGVTTALSARTRAQSGPGIASYSAGSFSLWSTWGFRPGQLGAHVDEAHRAQDGGARRPAVPGAPGDRLFA